MTQFDVDFTMAALDVKDQYSGAHQCELVPSLAHATKCKCATLEVLKAVAGADDGGSGYRFPDHSKIAVERDTSLDVDAFVAYLNNGKRLKESVCTVRQGAVNEALKEVLLALAEEGQGLVSHASFERWFAFYRDQVTNDEELDQQVRIEHEIMLAVHHMQDEVPSNLSPMVNWGEFFAKATEIIARLELQLCTLIQRAELYSYCKGEFEFCWSHSQLMFSYRTAHEPARVYFLAGAHVRHLGKVGIEPSIRQAAWTAFVTKVFLPSVQENCGAEKAGEVLRFVVSPGR